MAICCAGCDPTDQRLANAGTAAGTRKAERTLPDLPEDCRRKSRGGVQIGDRQDTALLKLDNALYRQHARTDRCAAWYDQLQAGLAGGPQ